MAAVTRHREKPIRFSDDEVRAILAGQKTQHCLPITPQPPDGSQIIGPEWYTPVVENRHGELVEGRRVWGIYDADGDWGQKCPYWPGMRLSVRWPSRITLEITEVRVQRVQEIPATGAAWVISFRRIEE